MEGAHTVPGGNAAARGRETESRNSIAGHCADADMDEDVAYVLGLLHDIVAGRASVTCGISSMDTAL